MVEYGELGDHPAHADPREVRRPPAERPGKVRRVGGEIPQGVGGRLRDRGRRLPARRRRLQPLPGRLRHPGGFGRGPSVAGRATWKDGPAVAGRDDIRFGGTEERIHGGNEVVHRFSGHGRGPGDRHRCCGTDDCPRSGTRPSPVRPPHGAHQRGRRPDRDREPWRRRRSPAHRPPGKRSHLHVGHSHLQRPRCSPAYLRQYDTERGRRSRLPCGRWWYRNRHGRTPLSRRPRPGLSLGGRALEGQDRSAVTFRTRTPSGRLESAEQVYAPGGVPAAVGRSVRRRGSGRGSRGPR